MKQESFNQCLNGRFDGMIRMTDVRTLEDAVALRDGWYLIEPGQALPEQSVDGAAACGHLHELVEEILREERGDWTTMVYAQSAEDPWVIKIFHPRRAGCGCGVGGGILPWWVLSRIPPEPVSAWDPPAEVCTIGSKRAWWQRLVPTEALHG